MALKVNGRVITDSTSTYIQLPTGPNTQRPSTPTVGMLRYNTTANAAEVYTTYLQNGVTTSSWQNLYVSSGYTGTAINGEALFTTPTTNEVAWQVPPDVTTIAVLCVGAGGSGSSSAGNYGGGGGGGALAYSNYISVTPTETLYYFVGGNAGIGSDGTDSYLKRADGTVLCRAGGGKKGDSTSNSGGAGGGVVSSNGGGGAGGTGGNISGGGGGAGGYSGPGGTGGSGVQSTGQAGSAGTGGGGGGGGSGGTNGGGGGGVGIYGVGTSGAGGNDYVNYTSYRGGGGSGGVGGTPTAIGGTYGGGGGSSGVGANGVVRIIWGPGTSNTGRQFPSNSVGVL